VVVELVERVPRVLELLVVVYCCGLTRELVVMFWSYLGRKRSRSRYWGYCERNPSLYLEGGCLARD
jgi:hypothetical protein